MKKKWTYWKSQSFRTLNHWQSVEQEDITIWTGSLFSGFKINGGFYPFPKGLKEPGSTMSQGYVWGGTNTSNKLYVLANGAPLKSFDLYGSMKHITTDNKHVIKAVWDCGKIKMESFAPTVSGVPDTVFPLRIMSATYRPLPGEIGTLDFIHYNANDYGMTKLQCCIPTLQKYYGVFCWYEEGYSNLIPQFLLDIQGTETQRTYTGLTSPVSTFSSYEMIYGPPHNGLLELREIYDDTQQWNIKIHGNVEKYSNVYTSSSVYTGCGGSTVEPYTNTDDTNMTQTGFSQGCCLEGNTVYGSWGYNSTYPINIGAPGQNSKIYTGWGSASVGTNIYNYDLLSSKYTRNYNSIRLYNNNVQVGAIYSTVIYRPTEIHVENVDFINIER